MPTSTEEKTDCPLLKEIPTLPAVAVQLLEAAMIDEADASRLVKIIKRDPPITAKVLQVANSPQYGFRGQVSTLERAVALLGNTAIRAIALGVSVFDAFRPKLDMPSEFDPRDFWKHSLGVALVAEAVGKKCGHGESGALFVAGLLHDIGRLALYYVEPDRYARVVGESFSYSVSLMERERAAFGADHTVYGQRLAEHWNLPRLIADSIRCHHSLAALLKANGNGDGASKRPPVYQCVAFADVIVCNQWIGSQGYQVPASIDDATWRRFGMTSRDDAALAHVLLDGVRQLAPIFETELDIEDLHIESLCNANRTLSQMSTELERRGQRLRQELMRSRFAESLHAKFSPVPDARETLASAVRVIGQALPGVRALGLFWAPRASEASVAVCNNPDSTPATHTVRTAIAPVDGETCMSRLKVFLCAAENGLDLDGLNALLSEGRMLILPFSYLQNLEGGLVLDLRGPEQVLKKWMAEPLREFTERVANAIERAWLSEDLRRQKEELTQARRLADNFRTQMRNTERLAAVGGMAAGVAHEINNPLSIIRGQAQLLLMREKDPDRQNRLRIIDEQSHRISKTLTELMGIARPHKPTIESVNVADILSRTLAMFKHRFLHRHVECEEHYDDDLPLIKADPDSLQEIFLNLIINADHALGKEGRLTVRARAGHGGRTVITEIEDTGCGISEENLSRIFEPFFTTKEKGKGTGLGLFTTHTIIESMHGDIQVRSRVNEGTCFTITLPVCQEMQELSARRTPAADRAPGQPPRILVIDDDPMIREILIEARQASDFVVDVAADGLEGTRSLERGHYDCVLLDLRMPHKSGVEVMQWLREHRADARPAPPVIAVTGITDVDETEAAIRLGALACVKKPFSIDTVIAEIEGALAKNLVETQF